MSSFVSSRLATVCVALGLVLGAGSARAQFEECVAPNLVPLAVFETILGEASFDFGEVSEKVCNGIAKKGASTCKSQVKGAEKCFKRAFDTNYAIAVKQCQQLDVSEDRAACKAEFKSTRDDGKKEIEAAADDALEICATEFADGLFSSCMGEAT